jgi:hypothetical protein
MEPLATYSLVKISAPAKPGGALDLSQPLAALAPAIAQNASSATRAHPAEKAVDSAAVPLLGLIGSFDRASVPEPKLASADTATITRSRARCALRYPQGGVIFRGRKQAGNRTDLQSSTKTSKSSN